MEENFPLTWEDATTVVQGEEVICDIENEILPGETAEFTGVCEEVVISQDSQNVQSMDGNQIMYITDDNVIVMEGEDEVQHTYQDNFIDCDVSEEIVTEQWGDGCPEEIIIGSEEAVGGTETGEDVEIPLPTDQDEYTAARPYPCDFCSRRFRKKVNLMNHMVVHQTDRPHGCNLCGTRYVRKCDLMNHLKIHAYIPETEGLDEDSLHPMEETDADRLKRKMKPFGRRRKKKVKEELETFESSPSGSRIYNYISEDMRLVDTADTKQEYVQYLSDNGGSVVTRYPITDPKKPFVCQHCGVGFAREKALASHARVHGGDSSFDCQKCGEMFWDVTSMREHLRMKHGETEELEDEEEDEYSEEDARFGTFYCPTCGICFHRQDLLKRHQKVHIKNENEFMTERDFGHSGHICNVCGDSFQEALDLLAHAEVHARTLEYRCLVCGEVSPDEQGVAAHVQTKHGKNLPPNTCMLCGRTCKDRRTLLKHSWEHSKEKQFACSKCAKTFHNKARLKRHMLSHRSKAVTCETCGEEFPDGRTLMNHRHSHSSVSGKQFPCKECGKTFGSRSSQQIHIRIHTGERPYGCRFCWKAFADGGTLRKHERIHTGEKPYACAVCPRAFNQRVVLREHIRSHHSAPDPNFAHTMTPYCCAVCSDMFSTSQDLIIHLIHHCDLNTAMRRQPPVGPRKYKRRRKLKPHELELISSRLESEVMEDPLPQIESEIEEPEPPVSPVKKVVRRPKKSVQKTAAVTTTAVAAATTTTTTPPSTTSTSASDPYTDLYNSCSSAIENINSIVNSKPGPKSKKKGKGGDGQVTSRPKMIHTQKTRVPVETGEDGRVRHRTKTIVSRTQPTELKPTSSERIRPRTKNVSYHIYNSEKIPMATFPENDAAQAVNSLMKSEVEYEINGLSYMESTDHPPEIASEQIVETEMPSPIKTKPGRKSRRAANNKKTGIAGKVVRIVKGGMIVAKKKKNGNEFESQAAMSENYGDQLQVDMGEEVNEPEMESEIVIEETRLHDPQNMVVIKQEMVDIVEQSPLHELAEISMQHAQSIFKCDMCSAVFGDRAQLLLHVPIHI